VVIVNDDEQHLIRNGYIKNPRRGKCVECRGYICRNNGWQYGEAKINGKRVNWAVMWHLECLHEGAFLTRDEQVHEEIMSSLDFGF
jgi:hypothetical protein